MPLHICFHTNVLPHLVQVCVSGLLCVLGVTQEEKKRENKKEAERTENVSDRARLRKRKQFIMVLYREAWYQFMLHGKMSYRVPVF